MSIALGLSSQTSRSQFSSLLQVKNIFFSFSKFLIDGLHLTEDIEPARAQLLVEELVEF